MKFHIILFNKTALLIAVLQGNVQIVKLLLTHQEIDVNAYLI